MEGNREKERANVPEFPRRMRRVYRYRYFSQPFVEQSPVRFIIVFIMRTTARTKVPWGSRVCLRSYPLRYHLLRAFKHVGSLFEGRKEKTTTTTPMALAMWPLARPEPIGRCGRLSLQVQYCNAHYIYLSCVHICTFQKSYLHPCQCHAMRRTPT